MKDINCAPFSMSLIKTAGSVALLLGTVVTSVQAAEYDVGVVAIGQSGYLVQGDTPVLATPFFNITAGNFNIDPASISYTQPLSLKFQVTGKLSYGLPSANSAGQGKQLYILAQLGIAEKSPIGNFGLTYSTDINGTPYGYKISASYDRNKNFGMKGYLLSYGTEISYLSANTVNYLYGIEKPNKHDLAIQKINRSGLIFSTNALLVRQITHRQFIFLGPNLEFFSGGITESSLLKSSWNGSINLGYSAKF